MAQFWGIKIAIILLTIAFFNQRAGLEWAVRDGLLSICEGGSSFSAAAVSADSYRVWLIEHFGRITFVHTRSLRMERKYDSEREYNEILKPVTCIFPIVLSC